MPFTFTETAVVPVACAWAGWTAPNRAAAATRTRARSFIEFFISFPSSKLGLSLPAAVSAAGTAAAYAFS